MHKIVLITLLILGLGLTTPVRADAPSPLDRAAAQVRKQTGGRILSVEQVEVDGERRLLFKVLTKKGRVRKVWVKPAPE